MGLPRTVNIDMVWGDAYEARATVEIGGAAVDLNDYSIAFTVKDRASDPDSRAWGQHTKAGGDITVNAAIDNMLHLALEVADTKAFPPNKNLYWDLKVTNDATAAVTTVYRGALLAER